MHPTAQSTFIPDLDMNPPPAWSKPASALGLANPLHHLPQSQQVRHLQEQIQQHRRLQQQQSQSGYELSDHVMRKKHNQNSSSNSNANSSNNTQDRSGSFQQPFGGGGGGGNTHQHINIKNTDGMNSDEEIDEDEDDEDEDGEKSDDRSGGMQGLHHHHRTLSHPQLTQGFSIPIGFAGFAPSSPLSPSSPGSIASESASMTASMLSPGLLSPTSGMYPSGGHGSQSNNSSSGNNSNSIHGIESSLASLASLSVMSSSSSSSSSSVMPMSMPGSSRGRAAFSSPHHSGQMATTPTTSSFQPQSLPVIYQNQPSAFHNSGGHNAAAAASAVGFIPTSSAAQSPSFNAFSSALSQHFQRQQQQQQQQQQMTSAAMSSSLPTHSTFNPFQQPQHQHTQSPQHLQQQQQHQQQQQQQQQQEHQQQEQQQQRSRSKSLTIPAPRIIPPARVLPPRAPQTSAPRKYHGRQQRKVPTAAPVPKEDVDPTRRVAHIISEQKRREKINGGFDELKSVIPECAQNTDSKATILRKATDYILLLEEELRKYTDLYQLEAGGDPESSLEGHERER
ncbi:hypothetical protein BGX23_009460 [Mortierella sp. AD031]|nr:hypothetical protein BGX23_009460 [Mortierella sp. AD031]